MDQLLALAGFGGSVTGGGASPQHTFRVTKTKDSGAGSFRAAVEAANGKDLGDSKLISIEVEGVTLLNSLVTLTASNCTITARHAPGVGWAVADGAQYEKPLLTVSGSNVLLEYLRLYRGTSSRGPNAKCMLADGTGAARHCSFMFCTDNLVTVAGRWTFSYCLFAWPLHRNHHVERKGLEAHGFGPTLSRDFIDGRCTMHMCAYAHAHARIPLRQAAGKSELIGCLTYGWQEPGGAMAFSHTGTRLNVRGSVWLAGSHTGATSKGVSIEGKIPPDDESIHIGRECIIQRPDFSRKTRWAVAGLGSAGSKCTNTPHDYSGETDWTPPEIPDPEKLGELVLPHVGAILPVRSYVDARALEGVAAAWAKTGHGGGIVDSVFKHGDPNTNPDADHTTAPLTNFANGAGWMEALDGKAVEPDGGTEVVAIARESDDIMENTHDGKLMDGDQLLFRNTRQVGLRFLVPSVPQAANIVSAHVQLTARKAGTGANTTTWFCEALDTGTFSGDGNVTGRTKTTASVDWPLEAWPTAGARGAAQKSPDLKTLVQEAVDHANFAGVVVFLVTTGTGSAGDRHAAGFGRARMAPAEVTIVWDKA